MSLTAEEKAGLLDEIVAAAEGCRFPSDYEDEVSRAVLCSKQDIRTDRIIHICPPSQDGDWLSCCGQSLADLTAADLLTMEADLVTCRGAV